VISILIRPRFLPLQHQNYDDAGNDNPCNATPETQFIRRDINQDKSNGQDSPIEPVQAETE
jgi:hypothetical protein